MSFLYPSLQRSYVFARNLSSIAHTRRPQESNPSTTEQKLNGARRTFHDDIEVIAQRLDSDSKEDGKTKVLVAQTGNKPTGKNYTEKDPSTAEGVSNQELNRNDSVRNLMRDMDRRPPERPIKSKQMRLLESQIESLKRWLMELVAGKKNIADPEGWETIGKVRKAAEENVRLIAKESARDRSREVAMMVGLQNRVGLSVHKRAVRLSAHRRAALRSRLTVVDMLKLQAELENVLQRYRRFEVQYKEDVERHEASRAVRSWNAHQGSLAEPREPSVLDGLKNHSWDLRPGGNASVPDKAKAMLAQLGKLKQRKAELLKLHKKKLEQSQWKRQVGQESATPNPTSTIVGQEQATNNMATRSEKGLDKGRIASSVAFLNRLKGRSYKNGSSLGPHDQVIPHTGQLLDSWQNAQSLEEVETNGQRYRLVPGEMTPRPDAPVAEQPTVSGPVVDGPTLSNTLQDRTKVTPVCDEKPEAFGASHSPSPTRTNWPAPLSLTHPPRVDSTLFSHLTSSAENPTNRTRKIDDDLSIDFDRPVTDLQSQMRRLQEKLTTHYPMIDTLPYEVYNSSSRKTLQMWLRILANKWESRFEAYDGAETETEVKEVLDELAIDHGLDRQACDRMADRFKEVLRRKRGLQASRDGEIDRDELDAQLGSSLRDENKGYATTTRLNESSSLANPMPDPRVLSKTKQQDHSFGQGKRGQKRDGKWSLNTQWQTGRGYDLGTRLCSSFSRDRLGQTRAYSSPPTSDFNKNEEEAVSVGTFDSGDVAGAPSLASRGSEKSRYYKVKIDFAVAQFKKNHGWRSKTPPTIEELKELYPNLAWDALHEVRHILVVDKLTKESANIERDFGIRPLPSLAELREQHDGYGTTALKDLRARMDKVRSYRVAQAQKTAEQIGMDAVRAREQQRSKAEEEQKTWFGLELAADEELQKSRPKLSREEREISQQEAKDQGSSAKSKPEMPAAENEIQEEPSAAYQRHANTTDRDQMATAPAQTLETRKNWPATKIKIEPTPASTATQPPPLANPLPHLTPTGEAHMVSVTPKAHTTRTAIATGRVHFSNPECVSLIRSNSLKKGDVLSVARIAGIQAAKQTPFLIPLCHPIALTSVSVELEVVDAPPKDSKGVYLPSGNNMAEVEAKQAGSAGGINVAAMVQCHGQTGVEMEALTAVLGASLTVIDMCKAVDKKISVQNAKLVFKEGGRSGTFYGKQWYTVGWLRKDRTPGGNINKRWVDGKGVPEWFKRREQDGRDV